ncbi:hypothetical protein [Azospirillum sp. sgz301742]
MKFPSLPKITTPAQIFTAYNRAVDQINQALQKGLDFTNNLRAVNTDIDLPKLTFVEIDVSGLGSKPSEVQVVQTSAIGNKGYRWAKAGGAGTFLGVQLEWYPVDATTVAVRANWTGTEEKVRARLRIMGE